MPTRQSSYVCSCIIVAASLVLGAVGAGHALALVAPTTPTFVLAWGSGGSAPTQFNSPFFVATDAQGNVYVPDVYNDRVQKFDFLGNFILQWGSSGTGNGQFSAPTGVAIDASGNVYITDFYNNRVQKFDANGNYLLQWGTAGAGNGQFSGPEGIAVDPVGNVYVGDYSHNRIEKFTNTGTYLTQWGSGGTGNSQFNGPEGIAIDYDGNVLVVDSFNHRVEKFSNTGAYLGQWGGFGTGNGQFNEAGGVAVDAIGYIYVADVSNYRIQKFDRTGSYLTQWGSLGSGNGQFSGPFGVGVDGAGNVYATDFSLNRIQKFSGAGTGLPQIPEAFVLTWGSQGTGAGQFSGDPDGVAVDAGGNVYVADQSRIQVFNSQGIYIRAWGSAGTGNGQFSSARFVKVDAAGNVYVSDYFLNRIQKFDSNGTYLTQWGTSGSGAGQFSGCAGIATDPAGNVYVADSGNNRVQKFNSTGAFLTQWGSTGTGDGQFRTDFGVATDAAGNVYVTDYLNSRIQKFSSSGGFLSKWSSDSRTYGIATDAAGNVYAAGNANRIVKYSTNGAVLGQWGTLGSGNGQFNGIAGLATDAAGNLYVSDFGNYRVQKFADYPVIMLVSDAGGDQGHRVRLRFQRFTADATGSGMNVLGYDVFLRADVPGPALVDRGDGAQAATTTYMVPATGAATYTVDVGAAVDATTASTWYSAFFVRAYTASSGNFDSEFGYGYSLDNIPPPVPSPFTAAYVSGATHLHWGVNSAPDFATFKLYRGSSATFTPGPANLVTATPDTGYADAGPAGNYYKLSAVDQEGNESGFALVSPQQTLSVPGDAPVAFALQRVWPNPASPRGLLVRFALPVRAAARLELFDVSGRTVVAREVGDMGVGPHEVDLAAGTHLRPGLYLIRLQQRANESVVRVTVLE